MQRNILHSQHLSFYQEFFLKSSFIAVFAMDYKEMTTKLKKKGFKIIQVGKLSFKQQIKLFNNAKMSITKQML